MPHIVLVAAVAENGVIGRGNALPWRLKSDMAHFRAVTIGKPVVMGRKTYLSIGKPLAGRTTIVVSRDRAFAAPGVLWRRTSTRRSPPRMATRCAAAWTPSLSPAAPIFMPRPCLWPPVWTLPISTARSTAMLVFRRSMGGFGTKSPAMNVQRRPATMPLLLLSAYERDRVVTARCNGRNPPL